MCSVSKIHVTITFEIFSTQMTAKFYYYSNLLTCWSQKLEDASTLRVIQQFDSFSYTPDKNFDVHKILKIVKI